MASSQEAAPAPTPSTTRTPYTGSCHCGAIRYIAHLTVPSDPTTPLTTLRPPRQRSSIYKCNCSVCQKMGLFHLRFVDAPEDFLLLSPLLGTDEEAKVLTTYVCNKGDAKWYFCKTCGVRCFSMMGVGELVDVDVDAVLGRRSSSSSSSEAVGGQLTKAWRPKKGMWDEFDKKGALDKGGFPSYMSVNAVTLDQIDDGEGGCKGPDLREWTENGWIVYMDCKWRAGEIRTDRPHAGGMY